MTYKQTHGNIVDAIKALQAGGRVYSGIHELRLSNGCLEWDCDGGEQFPVDTDDIQDDAFRIEWPGPRTPKRGEVWGDDKSFGIVLAKSHGFYVYFLRDEDGSTDICTHKIIAFKGWKYIRDATPEEMAQFDGGR